MAFWEGKRHPSVEQEAPKIMAQTTEVLERPRLPSVPKKLTPRVDLDLMSETAIAEYFKIAAEIGISAQDMLVEEFRVFLAKNDIPTFNLGEVVKYMDEIAAKDNPTGFGWHWCPVRAKDAQMPMTFGRHSQNNSGYQNGVNIAASDYYESHRFRDWHNGGGGWNGGWTTMGSSGGGNTTVHVHSASAQMQAEIDGQLNAPKPRDWRTSPSPAYTRTLPLHALKKIAMIERSFKDKAIFLVTDYCTAPHVVVNPDPFLMAVIPNSAVAHGKGRFIIDVWDEPGFGIDKMVK
jgi:hypothetical protein